MPSMYPFGIGVTGPYATDLFNDATAVDINSRALDTGQSWASATGFSGAVNTTGNGATGNAFAAFAPSLYILTADVSGASYTVNSTIKVITFLGTNNDIVVVGRCNSAGNTRYEARFVHSFAGAAQDFELNKIVSGTNTNLATVTLSGGDILAAGDTALIELVMSGTTISSKYKGVTKSSVTDSDISGAGRPGVMANYSSSSTTGLQFTDFNVTIP